MNRVLISGLFILFFGGLKAQSGTTLTLQQAIQTAIDNNVQVKQSDLLTQTAEVAWKQSRSNLLPDLNASASHGINQGRSIDPFTNTYVDQKINYANYGISSGVILFNGFSLQNAIKQNALSFEASRSELQQVKDNVTINVILAYLQVLNNQELVNQAKNQSDVSRKQLERLQVLNQQGATSPPLLADLKGQLMSDELNVVNMQTNLEQSKLALAQLMNRNYDPNMQVEQMSAEEFMTAYGATADAVYQKSLSALSLVKAAGLRRESAEAGLRSVRGELYPRLTLNGNINTNYSSVAMQNNQKIKYSDQLSNNLFSNVSLGLNIPIFNSFLVRNRIKLAQINIKSTQLAEENTKFQLRQSIDQAYLNMTNASDRLKLSLEQVNAYKESFRAAEVRFQSGVGTSVDYIITKNNLDRANINLITAKYDYLLRKKVLDFYSGGL